MPLYAVCPKFLVFFTFGNKLFSRGRVKINPAAVRMRFLFTKTRFPATRVVGIIHGCPCISLDIHGCLQPSMDCKTYVRKDIQRYPWIYMYLSTHECTWVSRELYRCPQPSMDFHTQLRMDIHGFKYIQRPRRFNSCKMLRDIVKVQASLIAKIKVSAGEFATGGPLYDATSAQKWCKTM